MDPWDAFDEVRERYMRMLVGAGAVTEESLGNGGGLPM